MKYQMVIHVFVDRALKTGCMRRSDTPMCFRYETFIRQLNKPRSSGRLIDTHSINGWLSYAAFLVLLAATTWALGVARSLVGSDGSVN